MYFSKQKIMENKFLLPILPLLLLEVLYLFSTPENLFLKINGLPVDASMLILLSYLGNFWASFGLLYPLYFYRKDLLAQAVCSSLLANACTYILKAYLARPRPAFELMDHHVRIIGTPLLSTDSTPSGHTTTVFAIATALYFGLSPKYRNKILFLLAAGTGFARICVGAHWVHDVLLGASIGLLSGVLSGPLVAKINFEFQKRWHREECNATGNFPSEKICYSKPCLMMTTIWVVFGFWLMHRIRIVSYDIGGPDSPMIAIGVLCIALSLLDQMKKIVLKRFC